MPRLNPGKIIVKAQGVTYALQGANINALEFIEHLDSTLMDRDYAVRFVHHQLVSPEMSVEQIRGLSNRVLGRILRIWAAHRSGFHTPLPSKIPTFKAFRQVSKTFLAEELSRVSDSVKGFANSIPSFAISDAALQAIKSIQTSVRLSDSLRITIPTVTLPEIAFTQMHSSILAGFEAANTFAQLQESVGNIARMSDYSGISEGLISALGVSRILTGQIEQTAAAIVGELQRQRPFDASVMPLLRSALEVSSTFSALYKNLSVPSNSVPSWVISRDVITPPRTTAIALATAKEVSLRVNNESIDDSEASRGIAQVRIQLAAMRNDFAVQWDGSWNALQSRRPDSLRQAAHSGRELLRKVLEFLAPDDEFTPDEKKLGHNGNPTRKMRTAKILNVKTSSSRVAWIESVVVLVDNLYADLSARAHDDPTNVSYEEVYGSLLTLCGVLTYLLSGPKTLASNKKPSRVFISYSRADSSLADRIEADMKKAGMLPWIDRSRLEGGQEWFDSIQRAIEDCEVLVIVLTPQAVESKYVRMELT